MLIAAMLEKALAEMRFCVENYATSRPSVREWANPSRNHQVDPSIGAITLDAYRAWNEVVVLSGRYSVCYTRITRYSLLHTYSLLTALTIYCPSHSLLTIHYSLLTTHYLLLTTHYSLLTTYYSLLTKYFYLLATPRPCRQLSWTPVTASSTYSSKPSGGGGVGVGRE